MVKRSTIVVAGHICLDITPAFPEKRIEKIEEILIPGHLIQMGSVDVHTGGAVANTGLALKILGADVKLMGKIGKDAFGKLVYSAMEQYGAAKEMIVSDESDTSYSVVVAPYGVDRIFLHHTGANDEFYLKDLDFELIKDAKLFHFGYPPLMKSMYEKDGEELIAIFKKVKELGAATSLDMAAVDEFSAAGRADWKKILKKLLPYVDFFVPSVEELAYMLDREKYYKWMEKADGSDLTESLSLPEDVEPLGQKLLDMGAKAVLIKCGVPGLYFASGNKDTMKKLGRDMELDFSDWADKKWFEKSYCPDKVLSGTGAGDTSIAAFLHAVTQGYGWADCLHLAAATGASCVECYDALSGLKSFEELEKKIKAGWKKIS